MAIPAQILIVEDDSVISTDLKKTLWSLGYEVTAVARSGEQALRHVTDDRPDLVLMDIRLSGAMDGIEVASRIRANGHIPVIYLTSHSNASLLERSRPTEPYGYLLKPYRKKELQATIEMALYKHEMECRLEAANRQLAREIEERKLLENALKNSERQLRALNASKDTFFSIIAHDLRNPFNSLLGLTAFLVNAIEDYDKDRLKSFISRLHTSAEKVYALLNNLLEWSRLERGLLQPTPQRIELCRLILFAVEALAADAARKQITLVNRVPEGMAAYADLNMLITVVRNLVSNAVKFTGSGGTIAISARQTGNVVELDISDTGIGISADGLNKLFRIDAKYARKGTADEDGTGLGLLLCKELVEKNSGSIRVESEVGKGSTFTVTLPIDD